MIITVFLGTVWGERVKGLTSLMMEEAYLAAWKNGVSLVYLKLPLFFSKEDLYTLCHKEIKLRSGTCRETHSSIKEPST